MRFRKTLTLLLLAMGLVFALPAWAQQKPVAPGFSPAGAALKGGSTTPTYTPAKPFTQDQVHGLLRAGLGDESGAKLIEQRGIDFVPAEDFVQSLKAAGASEVFLKALRSVLRGAQAKSQAEPVVKPGVISGRVFLITGAGDVEPARMAKVYLLYVYRGEKFEKAHKEDETAGTEWAAELTKALQEHTKETQEKIAARDFSSSESQNCFKSLLVYTSAFTKTLDWVRANKKEGQLIIGQADEEGNFRISVPSPGDYAVLVRGRAGFNEAVWESADYVTIIPGIETTIKMTSPDEACLVTSD